MSSISYKNHNLFFGTGGKPNSTIGTSTEDGIKRIRELNLDCMEIEWVRGVHIKEEGTFSIKKIASEKEVKLSVHAPYFINLNSEDKAKRKASMERIFDSARMGKLSGAESVVFHTGYYGNSPKEAYKTILDGIKEISKELKAEDNFIILRPETSGKQSQFGSLDEILNLCSELEGVEPCIDFAHLHARERGKLNTYEEFYNILEKVEKKLGKQSLLNIHIHVSGISYGDKGEKKHLNLKESDFRYDEWIQALKDFNLRGLVIIESPNLEQDAILLKGLYSGTKFKS
ncbi:MAG: TIM barrel protein [Acidobacteriota bacterium]